uniref:Uncharacterized protein n=1 Tax=Salarias fasciatus TaxID=181472 RepID=A0A672I866_SALFA
GPIKMSTDDSVSEDVSTSGALSHGHDGEKNLPCHSTPVLWRRSVALVQEIRSSGETDPEIWKDCELHLMNLEAFAPCSRQES